MSDAEDDEEAQTPEELRAKLDEYKSSLADVLAGLDADPNDEELKDLKTSLEEVIGITEDVLETTLAALGGDNDDVDGGTAIAADDAADDAVRAGTESTRVAASAAPAATPESLRETFVGKDVLALGSDQVWRKGRCVRVTPDGMLDVYLTESHSRMAVKASEVRMDLGQTASARPKVEKLREVYKGVPEPRRMHLTTKTEYVRKEPPKNLQIRPGDDAETRELKRKKLKNFKYKQRQNEVAAEQNAKASSWQNFQAKAIKKGKAGVKRSSIFALPEDLSTTDRLFTGNRTMTAQPQKRRNVE
jgi:survival-of-motor-neuron-related-splicing factor 30